MMALLREGKGIAMAPLTAELGRFVSALSLTDVPLEAQAVAKTGFTDCFAVMIAGAREDVVALVDRELAGANGAAQACLIPSGERRKVEDAALVNAVAAHVLDYDDVTLDGHPSAVLVPAILAQGEALLENCHYSLHCLQIACYAQIVKRCRRVDLLFTTRGLGISG